MTPPLRVYTIPTGPLQANCHVIHNGDSGEIVVADPGDDGRELWDFTQSLPGRVVEIWNTHGHIDHINGNGAVHELSGAPISIHELEADWLCSEVLCGAAWLGIDFHPSRADRTWRGGEELEALGCRWVVRHVPGHSPGSCALVCAEGKLVIGGDLLFRQSIGRTDLPGGDYDRMMDSLRCFFGGWVSDDMQVLCGHGPSTTVGEERRRNPFVAEALGSVGGRILDL